MKFLIDMPLSPAVAAWLVDQGHDAVHAADLGLHRASDSEIIDRAKQEGRTIITADLDYPRLLAVARVSEPSLILFRNGDWTEADVRRRLNEILGGLTETDIARSIITVDRDRVRRKATDRINRDDVRYSFLATAVSLVKFCSKILPRCRSRMPSLRQSCS